MIGDRLRVARDGLSYGFLDTGPGILGLGIFNLQGEMTMEHWFDEPIRSGRYDWDLDAGLIAYFSSKEDTIHIVDFKGRPVGRLDDPTGRLGTGRESD